MPEAEFRHARVLTNASPAEADWPAANARHHSRDG